MKGQVDQENLVSGGGRSTRRSSSGSVGGQKSFIPVPVALSSSPNNENSCVSSPAVLKPRRPLALQNSNSPANIIGKLTPKKDDKDKKTSGVKTEQRGSLTSISKNRVSSGVTGTPQNSPSKLKPRKSVESKKSTKSTTTQESESQQEDTETIAYWKELAESRRQALEDALRENYELHQRVEELEKENAQLEELVKEAEKLAIMINDVTQEEDNLDESGIATQ